MKGISMGISIMFGVAIACLIGAAYLYVAKETSDFAKAAEFTEEAKVFSNKATEAADNAIKATNEMMTALEETRASFEKIEERLEKLEKAPAAATSTLSFAPQTRPFVVEVIDRRPSKTTTEAIKRAKEVLKKQQLSQ